MTWLSKMWVLLFAAATLSLDARAADVVFSAPPLDHGFQLLYNLEFDRAHEIFSRWEQSHPDDPMGSTFEAVGFLFSEFDRLGVLEGQFLVDDKKFEDRPKLNPDPNVR